VRQHNSGAVEAFILPYPAVYLRIQKWKNYWNRSTFAKVTVKIKVARVFMAHGVYYGRLWYIPFISIILQRRIRWRFLLIIFDGTAFIIIAATIIRTAIA